MGSILDVSEKRAGERVGGGLAPQKGYACPRSLTFCLIISSSKVTYKIVASSGVRGNYKLFSPHDF